MTKSAKNGLGLLGWHGLTCSLFFLVYWCWKFRNSQVEIDTQWQTAFVIAGFEIFSFCCFGADKWNHTHSTHTCVTYLRRDSIPRLHVPSGCPTPQDHLRCWWTPKTRETKKIRLELQKLHLHQPAEKQSLQTETDSHWNMLTKSDSSVFESHFAS